MENFIVSARKYRPQTFESVVGQKHITETLKNAISHNQLAQAFLFCGPRGVGKTTCARIFARIINCQHPGEDMEPCNVCESCTSFNNNASFNIHELDAASNNSVEDIRSLVERVRIPPQVGAYKVYIIDEVHMLSSAAFNAFLKTLEEPPSYAKFILATTEKHKIIPTILSRCQIFDFKRITIQDIAGHLAWVAQKEGVEAQPEALHIIAQKADGAMRDALSIFDQLVSFSGSKITYESVIENLNVLDYDYYFRLMDFLIQGDVKSALLILDEIIGNGFDGQHFMMGFGVHVRNLLVSRDPATYALLEESERMGERYKAQGVLCREDFLITLLKLQSKADTQYKTSTNKRLLLELMLIEAALASGGGQAPVTPLPTTVGQKKNDPAPVRATPTPEATKSTAPSSASPSVSTSSAISPREHLAKAVASSSEQVPSVEQGDVVVPEKVRSAPFGLQRGKRSFSIRQEEEQILSRNRQQRDERYELKQKNEPVDEAAMRALWKEWAESHKGDQLLYGALTASEPYMKANGVVAITLESTIQERTIATVQDMLMEFLRAQLKNYTLTLQPEVTEEKREVKQSLSSAERLEMMAKKNPNLIELTKKLGLELKS